jgi:uncharacterized repeat protein (TIGR03803 family)
MALAALAPGATAQEFTVLQSFEYVNGDRPLTPPIFASDGNLYGATLQGGVADLGVIYRLTPQNELSKLHTFCALPYCGDGESPEFGPIQGKDGNLYGTTSNGGIDDLGVVYKLTLAGTLTVLHDFAGGEEGWYPTSLVEDGAGGFYGTTLENGAHQFGTIFHLSGSGQGKLTTLYSFCDRQPDCINAYSNTGQPVPLVRGSDGNIYGITATGGVSYYLCAAGGCGTVFKITPKGEFSIVYNFCSLSDCADGGQPTWLIQGFDGNFYGTTGLAGSGGGGTVFQLTSAGVLNTLHSFTSALNGASGYAPNGLIQAASGTLYGVTSLGGNDQDGPHRGCGTVFSVTTTGDFASLHSFDFSDGYLPAGLAQTSNNTLAGTTSYGGANGEGVIFRLNLN